MSFLISLSSWTLKIAHWVLEINVQSINQSIKLLFQAAKPINTQQNTHTISHTAVKSVHLIFTTAILDFWQMSTSRDNGNGTNEKLDPKNMGIAVGIWLLCALELEICLGGQIIPHLPANVAKKIVARTRVKQQKTLTSRSI